nr:hypothetical protein [Arthrobacter sp. ISL-72]
MPFDDTEPDRGAKVEDIHRKPGQPQLPGEVFDDVREAVERVNELLGALGMAEPRQVGRDHPVARAERVNETEKLVGSRGETMEEQQDRYVRSLWA